MNEQISEARMELYKKTLSQGEDLHIKVGGSSMWPFIKDGEVLLVRRVPFDQIYQGDVIITYVDQNLICHRVFNKDQQSVRTKADALVGLDAQISKKEILGKAIGIKRGDHVQGCDGWLSGVIGRCIVWITFLWAPMIPVLRWMKRKIRKSF